MFKILISLVLLMSLSLSAQEKFSQEQLDQMMAPIALYPDALLSQVLMAATFNQQLKEAIDYSKANPKEKGDEAVKKVQDKGWDASVSSLVAFPAVLDMLGKKPSWAAELGEAFLAEPTQVMDTVQNLRKKAIAAGNLKTSKQQTVKVDDSNSTQVIILEPATQTVYVPVYNPTYVYGTWWYAYPPYYYYPPYYRPVSGVVIGFGVGVVVTYALWGGFGWHHHNTYINVNHYNNINVNKISGNGNTVNWKNHNQRASTKKLDIKHKASTKDRQRDNARKAMNDKGLNLKNERKSLSGSKGDNLRKNLNSGKFQSVSHSNAFSGIDRPTRSHKEASRGSFSRSSNNRSFSSPKTRGGFSRGGGFSHSGGRSRGRR